MKEEFEIINGVMERYTGNNTDIVIPGGVVMLDEISWICPPVKKVTLPDTVRVIDSYAFEDCDALESVNIPDSTVTIGSRAFMGCASLEKISLPVTLTTIGPEAFYSCTSLREIEIPRACVFFGEKVFRDCYELSSLKVSPMNDLYDSRGDCNAVIRKQNNTLLAGCYTTVIPDSVTAIGQGAFYECRKLSRIKLGDKIVSIDRDAFGVCTRLKSVEIGDNVRRIGDRAFWNCQSLDTVIIPDSIKTIGNDVFYMCPSLRKVHVKSITGNEKIRQEIYKITGVAPEMTIKNAVEDDDIGFLSRFYKDYITKENISDLVRISAQSKSTEVSAFLLKLKTAEFASEDEDFL